MIYNQGTKENAGIFSQSQGWLILAEALRGHGNRAFEYFTENAPAAQNDRAEIRHLEPYCYGQFTEGPASSHFGRSHVHWLTGTPLPRALADRNRFHRDGRMRGRNPRTPAGSERNPNRAGST